MKSSKSSALGCFLFFPHSFPHTCHLGIRNQAMLTRQRVGGCSGLGHQRSGTLKWLQYTDRSRFAALVSSQRRPTPCGFQQTDTPPYPHPPKFIWVPSQCLYTVFCTNDAQVFEIPPVAV
jgi:hypothetical protein